MFIFGSMFFRTVLEERLQMLNIMNYVISIILFTLAFFQMTLSVQANIRDSQQQLGILRSMGMTQHDLKKVNIYEVLVNISSAVVIGLVVGLANGLIQTA